MANSTFTRATRQIMKVYAARAYTPKRPRLTNFVEVNIPEFSPTIPKDDQYELVGLNGSFFANRNYPTTVPQVKLAHCLNLPLLRGTSCPVYFEKDTPFLLILPTLKIEEGYLLYI